MSEIDCYRHKVVGNLECPTEFPDLLVIGKPSPIIVGVYQLLEPAPVWSAKAGDLIIGGGAGECPAFRISLPEAQIFFDGNEPIDFDSRSDLYQSYWRPAQAFALCNGFLQIGWSPQEDIETWLAELALDRFRPQV